MNEEIVLTLDFARECLSDANVLLEKSRYNASVSRSYYAVFHAAKAALLHIGVESITHQGVNVQFGLHFVKTGIFDKSLIRLFSKLLDTRLKADYEIGFRSGHDDAVTALQESTAFVDAVSGHLYGQENPQANKKSQ